MQTRRILGDESAKGTYFFNRAKRYENWRTNPKPKNEWGEVHCDPIVPAPLWEQVNQILEEQTKSWKRPGRAPRSKVFGNLAQCACGSKMYVRSNSPKYVCRKCYNKIPVVDLDAIFHEELRGFFSNHERIAGHLEAANRNLVEKQALLAVHERTIAKVRDEMARTHRLYLDGAITIQGFGTFYKPAEEQLNQLVAELPKLQAEVDFLKVNSLSADEVLAEALTLHDRWPTLATEDRRKIAESIVEKMVIGDGEIDITFSYLPSSEDMTKTQQRL